MIYKKPESERPSGATFAYRPKKDAEVGPRPTGNRLRSGPDPRMKGQPTGAQLKEIETLDRLHAWQRHHRQMALDSLMRLLRAPFSSLMTWGVLAIALSLPVALYVFLNNAQLVSSHWDGTAQISLYLHERVNDDAGRQLSQNLFMRPDVAETRFLSKEQTLAEFREFSGFGEALNYLDSNPLPAVIIVRPAVVGVEAQQRLMQELDALREVEEAQLDLAWVKRLFHIMQLGQHMIGALGVLLSLAVLLVIGNTIRLAIENRRQEIIVVKLIGATDAFVRRPFLYTGFWYGLGGGLLAWLLINLSLFWLDGPVKALASAYASDFSLTGLGLGSSLLLLLASTLLGWIGAWVAVGRHLGQVEPQ